MEEILFWLFVASGCMAMVIAVIWCIVSLIGSVGSLKYKILIIFGFSSEGMLFLAFNGIILSLIYNNL